MNRSTRRFGAPVLAAMLGAFGLAAQGPAGEESAEGTGFAGTWVLTATRDDVVARAKPGGLAGLGGGESSASAGAALRGGGGFDLPLEVMTDARRLVVTDDGGTFRAVYPSGRTRTFVTDGRKRYLDDGDGRADVTARRKGGTITVSSEWFRGYKLRETWELRASPRRLVVTGKVRGRESQEYSRTYEPGRPGDTVPEAAGASATPAPGATPAAETPAAPAPEPAPPVVDRLAECSVRAPRHASPEELARLVRVSQEAAGKVAVASVAPLRATDVMSSDVEPFEGCLVWPFTLRLQGKKGVQEVFVDAGDGKVVRSEFVPMATSPGEAAP